MKIRPIALTSVNHSFLREIFTDFRLSEELEDAVKAIGLENFYASIGLSLDENDDVICLSQVPLKMTIVSKWNILITGSLFQWKEAIIALCRETGNPRLGSAFFVLFDQAGLRNLLFGGYSKVEIGTKGFFILKRV